MSGKVIRWAFLVVVVSSCVPGFAAAQGTYISHHFSAALYCGNYWPSFYSREHIPYFAQHPPVYYSYPVRRTYGLSPYAWPPVVTTAQRRHPAKPPLVIRNPYVVSSELAVARSGAPRKATLLIVNSYVKQSLE